MSSERIGSGKTLTGQSREIVYNVFNYFLHLNKKSDGGYPLMKDLYVLTSEATGVSQRSVQRVACEVRNQVTAAVAATSQPSTSKEENPASSKILSHQVTFRTPGKKRPRLAKKSTVDSFDQEVIRQTIYNFHLVQHTLPTLKKVLDVLKESINFEGGISSLRKIVRRLGFRWRKTQNNKKLLIEKSHIRLKRTLYLSKLQEYRSHGRPIIYTDESYIHSSHTLPRSWSDETSEGCKVPISKGDMLVIVHACSEQGFIPEALLIYPAKRQTGDYHSNMNADNYQKWVIEKLLPNLPPQSVLVVDNASYHNVVSDPVPSSNSRKSDMLAWLDKYNIPYPERNTKPILYDILKKNKPNHIQFVLDKILEDHGHSVLRLPPYHPELNPIELLWGIIKGKVASQNVKFNLKTVEELFRKEADNITLDMFSDVWRKTREHEEKYIQLEPKVDNFTDSLIITLGNSDGETSSSSSDESLSGVEDLIYDYD
jgi:transposase